MVIIIIIICTYLPKFTSNNIHFIHIYIYTHKYAVRRRSMSHCRVMNYLNSVRGWHFRRHRRTVSCILHILINTCVCISVYFYVRMYYYYFFFHYITVARTKVLRPSREGRGRVIKLWSAVGVSRATQ